MYKCFINIYVHAWGLWRTEEGVQFLGTEVKDSFEPATMSVLGTKPSVKASKYCLSSPPLCTLNDALVTWLKRPLSAKLRGKDCLDYLIISGLFWRSRSAGIYQHGRKFYCVHCDTCLCKPSTQKAEEGRGHEFEASLSYLENTKSSCYTVRPCLSKQIATIVL